MLPFVIVACTIFPTHEIPVNVTSFDLEISEILVNIFKVLCFFVTKSKAKMENVCLTSGQDLFPRITNKTEQTKKKDRYYTQ